MLKPQVISPSNWFSSVRSDPQKRSASNVRSLSQTHLRMVAQWSIFCHCFQLQVKLSCCKISELCVIFIFSFMSLFKKWHSLRQERMRYLGLLNFVMNDLLNLKIYQIKRWNAKSSKFLKYFVCWIWYPLAKNVLLCITKNLTQFLCRCWVSKTATHLLEQTGSQAMWTKNYINWI